MSQARALIETLGADAIAAVVEVSPRTVLNKGTGKFPAYWYPPILRLCDEQNVKCSIDAFAFDRAKRGSAA